MRRQVYYFAVVPLVAAPAFIWLWQEPTTLTQGVNEAGRSSTVVPAGSRPEPKTNPTQPSAAAATIRLTQVSKAERAQGHEAGAIAASIAEPTPADPPTRKREGTSNVTPDSPQAPKPAEELLSAFVLDDPTQVFLPESVRIHSAVQSEIVDPDWGPAASQAIRDYFSAKFGDRFEIPVADCRQDLCELEAASRLGGNSDADMRDFQEALLLMKKQAWWSALQFDQDTGLVSTSSDGRALFVYFFSRK